MDEIRISPAGDGFYAAKYRPATDERPTAAITDGCIWASGVKTRTASTERISSACGVVGAKRGGDGLSEEERTGQEVPAFYTMLG